MAGRCDERFRVCLVNPMRNPSFPPLNLAMLAAYARERCGHPIDIRIVDVNFSKDPVGEVVAFDPVFVGFTALSPFMLDAIRLNGEMKRARARHVSACGGIHATVAPGDVLRHGFDVAVIGEGEQTLVDLIDLAIEGGGELDRAGLAGVDGIAYLDGGEMRTTAPRELVDDLDQMPHAARELLSPRYYDLFFMSRGATSNRFHTIHGSRACPFKCIFCCVNFTVKSKVRRHSPEYIVDEMEELVRRYRARWVWFTDDTFFVDKKHTAEMCELIIARGLHRKIKWDAQIRSSLIKEGDVELLRLMRRASCRHIDIGFESFNARMLSVIKGNNIKPEDHHRAIDVVNRAGLKIFGTFILGTPSETEEEMMETVRHIESYSDQKKLHFFLVGNMQAYPGTRVYEMAQEKGMIRGDYIESLRTPGQEHHNVILCDTVPAERVRAAIQRLHWRAFLRIPWTVKVRWVLSNLFKFPGKVLGGMRWFLANAGAAGSKT